jgi:SnoaL-like domain
MTTLQALLDKQEITELLTRYLRSVDRGDVATLRSCYLPGATEDTAACSPDRPRTMSTASPPR